jgi:hypothetical protein
MAWKSYGVVYRVCQKFADYEQYLYYLLVLKAEAES